MSPHDIKELPMTKTAFISGVFVGYVAIMFVIASLAGETPSEVSKVNLEQTID
jgi:uncharacterized membrane protein YczE